MTAAKMKDENKNPSRVDLLSPSLGCKAILHPEASQVKQRLSLKQVHYTPYGTISQAELPPGLQGYFLLRTTRLTAQTSDSSRD